MVPVSCSSGLASSFFSSTGVSQKMASSSSSTSTATGGSFSEETISISAFSSLNVFIAITSSSSLFAAIAGSFRLNQLKERFTATISQVSTLNTSRQAVPILPSTAFSHLLTSYPKAPPGAKRLSGKIYPSAMEPTTIITTENFSAFPKGMSFTLKRI